MKIGGTNVISKNNTKEVDKENCKKKKLNAHAIISVNLPKVTGTKTIDVVIKRYQNIFKR